MVRVGWFCIAFLCVILSSCAGSSPVVTPADNTTPVLTDSLDGFSLTVDPASLLEGTRAAAFTLAVESQPDQTVVRINAAQARSLKALYCTLSFDPERYTPVAAAPVFDPERQLYLDVTPERGVLEYGQVLRDALAQPGFSGDGALAAITFAHAGQPPVVERSVCAPPVKPAARAELMLEAMDTLVWPYANPGDYNEDGLVGVSDLTPLGVHFNKTSASADWNAARVADGNDDGAITVADITTIGQNFNAFVEGYNVYMSPDLPGASTGPFSADDLLGSVTRENAVSNDGEPLWFMFPFLDVIENDYLWVVPYHGDEVGIASNWTNGPLDTVAQLALAEPALEGRGARVDPYLSYADESLTFTLTDGSAGDVSASDDTRWLVWPEEAGAFTPGTGELVFDPSFSGTLYVSASYQGGSCFPFALAVLHSPNQKLTSFFRNAYEPHARITASPPCGRAWLTTLISARSSIDYNYNIQQCLWKHNGRTTIQQGPWESFTGHKWDFSIDLPEGMHKFELEVIDGTGMTDEASVIVPVTPHNWANDVIAQASPTEGWAPLTVRFHPIWSNMTIDDVASIDVDVDSDGRVDLVNVDRNGFEYTYLKEGIYRAWFIYKMELGKTYRYGLIITVFPNSSEPDRPWIDVLYTPHFGYAPLVVDVEIRWWDPIPAQAELKHHANELDKPASSIDWNPGSTSPTHATLTFTAPGEYNHTFWVVGSSGSAAYHGITVRVWEVAQTDPPPTCTLEGSPSEGAPPLEVEFDADWIPGGSTDVVWAGVTGLADNGLFCPTDKIDHLTQNQHYTYKRTYPQTGTYVEKLYVIDSNFRVAEDWVEIVVAGEYNNKPWINVTCTPDRGLAPLTTHLVVDYGDFDGDPVTLSEKKPTGWEEVPGAAPYDLTFPLYDPGLYEFTFRVNDNRGGSAEATAVVLVGERRNVTVVEIDTYEVDVEKTSDGKPVVTYSRWTGEKTVTNNTFNENVYVNDWSTPEQIVDDAGYYVETEPNGADNGFETFVYDPHVAHLYHLLGQWSSGGSKAKSTSALTWSTPELIEGNQNMGANMSLAVIGGYPALAGYQNEAPDSTVTKDLLYFYSEDDGTGGLDWHLTTIDANDTAGLYINLIQGVSAPQVAYIAKTAEDHYQLRFASGADAAGSSWNTPVTVFDDQGIYGIDFPPALCLVDGHPLLIWGDNFGMLELSLADDAAGTSWSPAAALTIGGYRPTLVAMTDTQLALIYLSLDRTKLEMLPGSYDPSLDSLEFSDAITVYEFGAAENAEYLNYDVCYTAGEAFPSIALVDSSTDPDSMHYVTFEPQPE
ncbi:hypothetical protein JW859_13485 [bacterium]|nr:hypothetical protein [bacterium]